MITNFINDNLCFNERVNKDFDMRKMYEETVLKILNECSRQSLTHPENSSNFSTVYSKPTHLHQLKRTVFLDLDDTLVLISLYKINS